MRRGRQHLKLFSLSPWIREMVKNRTGAGGDVDQQALWRKRRRRLRPGGYKVLWIQPRSTASSAASDLFGPTLCITVGQEAQIDRQPLDFTAAWSSWSCTVVVRRLHDFD